MLHIYQSTDLDLLTEHLLDELTAARRGVFDAMTVIVPSMALGDYLDQSIARRDGISARMNYRFWGMFEWSLIEKINGREQIYDQAPLSGVAMHWTLFSFLYRRCGAIFADPDHPLHSPVRGLVDTATPAPAHVQRLWFYAGEMSKLFVGYLALRPDWLALWRSEDHAARNASRSRRKDGDASGFGPVTLADFLRGNALVQLPRWLRRHYEEAFAAQRFLWRTLFAEAFSAREALVARFTERLRAEPKVREHLPPDVFLFTIFSLSEAMLDFLQTLGRYTEVRLYHHGISDAYLPDIVDSRWLRRMLLADPGKRDQHYVSGHPLVSRFGKQQRAVARLLEAHELLEQVETLPAREPVKTTLLARLQADMRALAETATLDQAPLDGGDDSLRIHGCHGFSGQLEVLRGELVRWLNADATRRLEDILIVVPEVASCQDMIRAVFPAHGAYDGYRLPARLTGVSGTEAETLWQAVSGLYTLLDSDFDAQTVTDWLSLEAVCAAYGISCEAMQRICRLLVEAGFHRGFDTEHLRTRIGVADGDDRFTFTYALDRLVAGFVLPDAPIYAESVVPQRSVQMADREALEALCALYRELLDIRVELTAGKNAAYWLRAVQNRLGERLADYSNGTAYQLIMQTLRDLDFSLRAHLALAPAEESLHLPLAFVLRYVGERLAEHRVGSEPSGVITIGRIGAMRGIPYKLIAFAGADEEAFPGKGKEWRHNLIAIDEPRTGDRQREWDDLGAFLDLIGTARESFWCLYSEYLPQDGEERLPAAPVQELLAYLDERIAPEKRHYHLHHGPDPFRPDPHAAPPAPLWRAVGETLAKASPPPEPWVGLDVPETLAAGVARARAIAGAETEPPGGIVRFERIVDDLLHPAGTFLRAQQVRVIDPEKALDRFEPLVPDPLQRWRIDDTLLRLLEQPRHRRIFARLPFLPAGVRGELLEDARIVALAARRAALFAATGARVLTACEERRIILGERIVGAALPRDGRAQWLRISASKARVKHLFRLWMDHLLWQYDGHGGRTICAFQGDDGQADAAIVHLTPLTAALAERELGNWLAVWEISRRLPWLMPIELGWAALEESGKSSQTHLENCTKRWFAEDRGQIHKEDAWTNWRLLLDPDHASAAAAVGEATTRYAARLLGRLRAMLADTGGAG